jgi:hypothetical protein
VVDVKRRDVADYGWPALFGGILEEHDLHIEEERHLKLRYCE